MKPELTKELKERFFAQYMNSALFQVQYINVDKMSKPKILNPLGYDSCVNVYNPSYSWLILRPLSSITNEEAIVVADMSWYMLAHSDKRERIIQYLETGIAQERIGSHVADYLRSKSFAIPFMGHSVEELISAGWIKLTTETKEKQ